MIKSAVIRQERDKFKLYSHKGKVLGTHPTREAALKQERAVHAAKHGSLDEDIQNRANEKLAKVYTEHGNSTLEKFLKDMEGLKLSSAWERAKNEPLGGNAQIKTAGLDDLLGQGASALAHPAIKGALGLTALTAPLSVLDAYANDENVFKNMAGAAKWTLPLGALGGAAYGHSSALMDKILSKIPTRNDLVSGAEEVYNHISPKIEGLMGKLPNVNPTIEELLGSVKGLGSAVSETGSDVGGMLKDLSGNIRDTGKDVVGLFNR